MERLDLLIFTAFTPVFCLTFLIIMDMCASYAMRRRYRALRRYQIDLVPSPCNVRASERAMGGRHHA